MRRFLVPIVLLVLLVTGCAAGASLHEPPGILYGEEECDRCRMLISDERYAAAYMTEEGQVRRFDDIGGMFLHHVETGDEVEIFWVHDLESKVWVKADEAYFVKSDALETPMGFGIAALNSHEEAEAMAAEVEGEVVSFSWLMDQAIAGNLMPAHAHGHGRDSDSAHTHDH